MTAPDRSEGRIHTVEATADPKPRSPAGAHAGLIHISSAISHDSAMRIDRLQVEEGFLDGLDLTFAPGLNVIIGARGVGKTSVLQLLRYVMRLPHVDQKRSSMGKQHAEAILGEGRAIVTLSAGELRRTVARSANDPEAGPSPLADQLAPLILGQNELEGIGLDPTSRLRLLDTHANLDTRPFSTETDRLRADARAITVQLQALAAQREALRQQTLVRSFVEKELQAAKETEAALLRGASSEINEIRRVLREAAETSAGHQRTIAAVQAASSGLREAQAQSDAVLDTLAFARSELTSFPDLAAHSSDLDDLDAQYREATRSMRALVSRLDAEKMNRQAWIASIDDDIRPLRRQFEEFEEGAGAAARQTASLEKQLADLDATEERLEVLHSRERDLRARRASLLNDVDLLSEEVWNRRLEAATSLNQQFAPRIRLVPEHYGDRSAYTAALATALRGSGLQYNQLAEWLSERISPEELVSAVEAGDAARLAIMGELTSARVEKLAGHLAASPQLADIITAEIDDSVSLELLVGRDYRSSDQLSTGQRCAAVLPILLADQDRVLILDQPEDHLDNAYLVDNTIRSLLERGDGSQTIIATHNANVPVLGNANRVFALESDGRRGYVRVNGSLFAPSVVQTISELMEGGKDAFARRAAFYAES